MQLKFGQNSSASINDFELGKYHDINLYKKYL